MANTKVMIMLMINYDNDAGGSQTSTYATQTPGTGLPIWNQSVAYRNKLD